MPKKTRMLAYFLSALLPILGGIAPRVVHSGFAVLEREGDQPLPSGAALYSFTKDEEVLIWEAGVPAVEPIDSGRTFFERSSRIDTALAVANPSDQFVDAVFVLRDVFGHQELEVARSFAPWEHLALFSGELFPGLPGSFIGSLSFRTMNVGQRLAAIALRQSKNSLDETIVSSLPVVKIPRGGEIASTVQGEQSAAASFIFPHIGLGTGLATQLILINPGPQTLTGRISLTATDGAPLTTILGDKPQSEIGYVLEPNGVFRVSLRGDGEAVSGYAEVTSGTEAVPFGVALFQILNSDAVITEAGVAAVQATTRIRLFVDKSRTRTGLALAWPNNTRGRLSFGLLDRYGQLLARTTRPIDADGQLAVFADELFPQMPPGFTGLVDISAEDPFHPISLKLTINSRGDPILTTLPVADLREASDSRLLVFPQIGSGDGLATRLILINRDSESETTARLRFFRSGNGEPMPVTIGEETVSELDFRLEPGGAVQFRPGNTAPVASISLDSYRPGLSEIVVQSGKTLHMRPRIVDVEGNPRDDFTITFLNLDETVAEVTDSGQVKGLEKGFSTLTVEAGSHVARGMLSVVDVIGGVRVGPTGGIAEDLAGRIYMAGSRDHVIYLAESIDAPPVVFAGVQGIPGLRDGKRGQSLFNRPSFLALNHATGDLFVSDSGNHVIRVVRADGYAETFAGAGMRGSQDGPGGPGEQASFSNPQGIALDLRSFLWVADSDNHTVRRIDLRTRWVESIAGRPGVAGNLDGQGAGARFDRPLGIAPGNERFLAAFEGPASRNLAMLVVDSGNRRIRRVDGEGRVATLKAVGRKDFSGRDGDGDRSGEPLRFVAPKDVRLDAVGNLYVTDPGAGTTHVVSESGMVSSLQAESHPIGVSAFKDGRIVVSEDGPTRTEFGAPRILSVEPPVIGKNTVVIVRGRNFTEDNTVLILGSVSVSNIRVQSTQVIVFETGSEGFDLNGAQNLTIASRGGWAQSPLSGRGSPLRLGSWGDLDCRRYFDVRGRRPFALIREDDTQGIGDRYGR